jgi:hypothetical protein
VDKKSFDLIFYRWLLRDEKIEVFPAGNCHNVEQVVGHRGIWAQVSSDVKIAGIIDSDYTSDQPLTPGVVALPLHEAKSYACIPDIVLALSKRIGRGNLDADSLIELIVSEIARQKVRIIATRFSARTNSSVNFSIGLMCALR